MGLLINRQNNLDRMFEKFASDPLQPAKKDRDKDAVQQKETSSKKEKQAKKK
jgi:hypothetical protein